MRKLVLIAILTCALMLGIVVSVSADNGPHGSFTSTTDACASCHRAHSAAYGSNGLLISNPEALCLTCHDGAGASTNVEDGIYTTGAEGVAGGSLFGGGFVNATMATAWSGHAPASPVGAAGSLPVTSTHSLGVQGAVYGSGGINTANGAMTLECTSCHDPHGNAGFAMSANTTNASATVGGTVTAAYNWSVNTPVTRVASYRLLRFQPAGSAGFTVPAVSNWSGGAFPTNGTNTGWTVPDNMALGEEWYTIGAVNSFSVGDYNAGNATNVYDIVASDIATADPTGAPRNYKIAASNVAYFCAQCHDRYFANSRSRNNTDTSLFCGTPGLPAIAGRAASATTSGLITLTVYADADGAAPWIHPVDPVRCEAVVSATNGSVNWGDNGSTGDSVHAYLHASGDVLRASADGSFIPGRAPVTPATAMTNPQDVGRSCIACHVSHGTTAAMTTLAAGANLATGANAEGDSTLLRMDNRSLCLRCHADTVGFTVLP
jgi:predicted CXXCH cytochrome family protein